MTPYIVEWGKNWGWSLFLVAWCFTLLQVSGSKTIHWCLQGCQEIVVLMKILVVLVACLPAYVINAPAADCSVFCSCSEMQHFCDPLREWPIYQEHFASSNFWHKVFLTEVLVIFFLAAAQVILPFCPGLLQVIQFIFCQQGRRETMFVPCWDLGRQC